MEQHFEAFPQSAANHAALTPISFLARAEAIHGAKTAVIYEGVRRTWSETAGRIRSVASALLDMGVGKGTTVSVIAPNIPELMELHFAVPLTGAVLNAINIRLEAETIAYILDHADSQLVIVDREFAPLLKDAFARNGRDIPVVEIVDPNIETGEGFGGQTYEDLAAFPAASTPPITDEWQAIALNYTSGTSGRPKGVVYSHRGAYLIALGTMAGWQMPTSPVYLSVVPMFHCNGWGHPWLMPIVGGTAVFTRMPVAAKMLAAIKDHGVTHFGGAPIILQMLVEAAEGQPPFNPPVKAFTAGAPPPPSVLQASKAIGLEVEQVYGLTETYGHITQCTWQRDWDSLADEDQAAKQAAQGVAFPMLEAATVLNPETGQEVPRDGETQGEIAIRGNVVMKGYYKDAGKTDEAFRDGWFWSGDAAVMHPDGYIQIKDRLKDVIISGGENISSVEVEAVLFRHPAVLAAAVVAKPDDRWGEVPCAFVELRDGVTAEPAEIIAFCREHLAGFKTPKAVVFGELPKTSTGKIQKFILREKAKDA